MEAPIYYTLWTLNYIVISITDFITDYGKDILVYILGIWGALNVNVISSQLIAYVKDRKYKSHLYKEIHFNYKELCEWVYARQTRPLLFIQNKDSSPPLLSKIIFNRVVTDGNILDFISEDSKEEVKELLKLSSIYKEIDYEVESYQRFVRGIELHIKDEDAESVIEYQKYIRNLDFLRRQLKPSKHAIFTAEERIN